MSYLQRLGKVDPMLLFMFWIFQFWFGNSAPAPTPKRGTSGVLTPLPFWRTLLLIQLFCLFVCCIAAESSTTRVRKGWPKGAGRGPKHLTLSWRWKEQNFKWFRIVMLSLFPEHMLSGTAVWPKNALCPITFHQSQECSIRVFLACSKWISHGWCSWQRQFFHKSSPVPKLIELILFHPDSFTHWLYSNCFYF